jgi:hydrogenase-1 operon protein HyaF
MTQTMIPIQAVDAGAVGPGSQPVEQEGGNLEFIKMPSEMMTYAVPVLPEVEDIEGLEQGINLLAALHQYLLDYKQGDAVQVLDLTHLDEKNRQFINEAFGDGEVSVLYHGSVKIDVQESVLAGLWRVHYRANNGDLIRDTIEIGEIPDIVQHAVFTQAKTELAFDEKQLPQGLMNATSLIAELNDKVAQWQPGKREHVINLSLLPHTPEDIVFLGELLGSGPVVILSRGYGNCRITSTTIQNVWWVQYYNSQDSIILNTIEVSDIPKVACASAEDIADSAQRMGEILDIYR